jgi:Coenzyme PQQ synthesis protein D (PqqD)
VGSLVLDDAVQRRSEILVRDIEDGAVLVDMASGKCWELNRVGALLWTALSPKRSLRQSCESIAGQFGVPLVQVEEDALRLANDLLSAGLILPCR